MAGKDPEIGIGLNVDGFVQNAKKAQEAGNKVGKVDLSKLATGVKSIGSGFAGIGRLALGVFGGNLLTGAAAKLARSMGSIARAIPDGIEAALVDRRIADRVKKVFGPDNFNFIDETSNKIKSAFGIDDGDARKAMTLLGEMGMTADLAANSMSLAADIARAKNMSIEASSKLVGKAYQGNEAAAKKLGIQIQKTGDPIKDQARLMDALQKKFGGAAGEYAKNLPPLEKAKVAISDMVKAIGAKLIPVVVPFLQNVSNWMTAVANSEGFSNFATRLSSGITRVWNMAKSFAVTLLTYGIAFVDIIKQLPAAVGKMWDSGKLMEWVIAMIGAVLKMAWDGAVMWGKLAWAALTDGVDALGLMVGKALVDVLRSALGEKISSALGFDKASDSMNEKMKESNSAFKEKSTAAFSEWAQKAKDNFGGAGDISRDMFKNEGGLDMGASVDRARKKTASLLNFGDGVKKQMADDAAELYGRTGKASQTIGFSEAGRANALMKVKKKLKKSAAKDNKKARGGLNLNLNLQSADRINPIMATL
jgi:hypothetical protein